MLHEEHSSALQATDEESRVWLRNPGQDSGSPRLAAVFRLAPADSEQRPREALDRSVRILDELVFVEDARIRRIRHAAAHSPRGAIVRRDEHSRTRLAEPSAHGHHPLAGREPNRLAHGDTISNHSELSAIADAAVAAIAKGRLRSLQHDKDNNLLWKKAVKAIHDVYLGPDPTTFTYKGATYTPKSFFESTGLKASDYISLTSYTHHPFYEPFVLEIQDNWRWAQSYNLPIDELMEVFDNAINNGYTVLWGSDVSEEGFNRQGIGVVPDIEKVVELSGSDMAHWLKLPATQRDVTSKPSPQKWVTQAERQLAYDNYETTDDHGMLIYGTAKDQNGTDYYMVKNSWGDSGKYHGLWYVSKAFARYKTMNIVVNKKAVPKSILDKLGVK